ncbi:MAG: hypothetical protein V1836_01925 [Candidatus Aenigmatarchaeota archaeon]
MKNIKKLIKGEKPELGAVAEEALIATLITGAVLVVIGVVLSSFMPIGIAPLMAMSGALLSFLSLIFMITFWFSQEGFK